MAPHPAEDADLNASFIDPSAVPGLVQQLREAFDSGRTRPLEWRERQLRGVLRMLQECEAEIMDALRLDVGKPTLEGYSTEIAYTSGEIHDILSHLKKWTRPEKVTTPLIAQPGKSQIYKDPLGVVLVIAPWNYPLQLALGPALGAIAAGNCVIIKPSEVTPNVSRVLASALPRYVDTACIQVVEGAVPETSALLAQRFDHIFYTGNGQVGRIVMAAAAKHLTPVTLELGGKSPCFVDRDADLAVTARRVAWGKFFNAGQTCVAPDYVLVHRDVHDAFVEQLQSTLRDFYGDNPKASPDFARIVNKRHHKRLVALLDGSGQIAAGGDHDEDARYIAPTLLTHVPHDAPVMADEIFGPILPILRVDDVDAAIRFINARPKPLALYIFSGNTANQEQLLTRTSSGGVTVNHAWLHLSVPELPFGGVGESGMGAYHGQKTFDTFTHRKSVLRKPFTLDVDLIYPPYSEAKLRWIKRLL